MPSTSSLEARVCTLAQGLLGVVPGRLAKPGAAGQRPAVDQLLAALSRFGLKPVDAEGLEFDPHRHEAVTHVPSEEHPENVVIAQTRRGYLLGDRLLRAAQVVVSSGLPVSAPAPEEGDHGGE